MKKSILILGFISITMLFTSCFEKLDNWYTNTFDYDGRYTVAQTYSEEMSSINKILDSWGEDLFDDKTSIEDGSELWIYNSSANKADELIIDTHLSFSLVEAPFPVKGKFKITGDPSNFKGQGNVLNLASSTEINYHDDGEFFIIYHDVVDEYYEPGYIFSVLYRPTNGLPDALGDEWDAIQFYTRVSMEECKITSLGATTIGGNKSDAVNAKITTYCDFLIVESYQTAKETWADPEVPEFDWRIKEGSRKNADGWEEHWTLSGYRYTGYPEDLGIIPPIIVK